jgi:hypothetical protein
MGIPRSVSPEIASRQAAVSTVLRTTGFCLARFDSGASRGANLARRVNLLRLK